MPEEHRAILGLPPGRHDAATLRDHFERERRVVLALLHDPRTAAAARERLDRIYIAYQVLRNAAEKPDPEAGPEDDVARLRRLIEASLEDGLLRFSRRQAILAAGRRLGFSDFHTQLLIAQVQYGGDVIAPLQAVPPRGEGEAFAEAGSSRGWRKLAAAGALAIALFVLLVHWLEG